MPNESERIFEKLDALNDKISNMAVNFEKFKGDVAGEIKLQGIKKWPLLKNMT